MTVVSSYITQLLEEKRVTEARLAELETEARYVLATVERTAFGKCSVNWEAIERLAKAVDHLTSEVSDDKAPITRPATSEPINPSEP